MPKLIKISFLTCFFATISLWGGGQNLVPNASFEDTVFCPWAESQMPLNWMLFGNSADYYNSCSSALNVPNTPTGYHQANSGVGMIGVYNYVDSMSSGWPDYREYVGIQLANSLTIGQKYYMSFFLSYGKTYSFGCNCNGIGSDKLGLKFSTVQYSENNPPPLNNSAHLYTNSIYTDTAQWIKISGSFIADSAYNYLMIGNFFDEVQTNSLHFGGPPYYTFESYYFIDDICVTTDSLYNVTWAGLVSVEENNFDKQFYLYPNPATDIFNIQNSSSTPFNVSVYNSIGQLLYSKQNITSNSLQLDVSSYDNGLLFIKITSQNNQFMYKLLKQ